MSAFFRIARLCLFLVILLSISFGCSGGGGDGGDGGVVADTTPPPVPAGLTATTVSAVKIDLAWSASAEPLDIRFIETGLSLWTDSGGPRGLISI